MLNDAKNTITNSYRKYKYITYIVNYKCDFGKKANYDYDEMMCVNVHKTISYILRI